MKLNTSSRAIGRFVVIALAVGLSGLIVGVGVGYIATRILWNRMEFGGLAGMGVGIAVGYPLGVFIGLVIVKGYRHVRGSILLGLSGIIIAEFLTLVLPYLARSGSPALTVLYLVLTPFLASAGYLLGGRTTNSFRASQVHT